MTPDRHLQEDLLQVGRIAVWEACLSFNQMSGSLPAWVMFKARNAMFDHFRRPKWGRATGNEPLPDDNPIWDRLVTEDPDVDWMAHRREVVAAINTLTPRQREYVYLRFFEGYKSKDLRQHFGYDPQGLWSSPKNGAKNKLRPLLVHLTRGTA